MKKILSIAAVSVFSTAILSVSANATTNCTYSFESYAARLKESSNCRFTTPVSIGTICNDDKIIQELLKDCEVKYFDWSDCFPGTNGDQGQNPDNGNNGDNSGNGTIIPGMPSKPETDDNVQENVPNNDQNANQGTTNSSIQQQIIDLVNKERTANGLRPVTATNSALNSAAAKRAQEQASSFSHTRPNGSSWTTVLSEYGVSYRTAGENVAYGQRTAQEVMNAWMNSSGHRANILNGNYTELGVGVYYKNGTYYWSQLFIG